MPARSLFLLGLGAGLTTALIGASWQVLSRAASLTALGPVELAVLRYCIPALLLLPFLWRVGLWPSGLTKRTKRTLLMLVCGGGLPFGLLVFAGSRLAPVAHMGVLIAATGPLITAALLWLIEGRRVTPGAAAGLLLIAIGVVLITGQSLQGSRDSLLGDALFLLAAVIWSLYGIAFRGTTLTPWQGAALVNGWSALMVLPLVAWFGVPGLLTIDVSLLALHALWQGVIAGVFGLVSYTLSVRHLGATGAAAFGALVPVLSALGGWWLLDEPIDALTAAAAVTAAAGVALAAGLWRRPMRDET